MSPKPDTIPLHPILFMACSVFVPFNPRSLASPSILPIQRRLCQSPLSNVLFPANLHINYWLYLYYYIIRALYLLRSILVHDVLFWYMLTIKILWNEFFFEESITVQTNNTILLHKAQTPKLKDITSKWDKQGSHKLWILILWILQLF